jgi:hypothetical protein
MPYYIYTRTTPEHFNIPDLYNQDPLYYINNLLQHTNVKAL